MKSVRRYYRIDRRQIAFLKFILEAYDGIATLSTVDSRKGVICLDIPPGSEPEVQTLLEDLRQQMIIEEADARWL